MAAFLEVFFLAAMVEYGCQILVQHKQGCNMLGSASIRHMTTVQCIPHSAGGCTLMIAGQQWHLATWSA